MGSQLLLAILHDTGWYRADFSASGVVVPEWGRGGGCKFVSEKCVDSSGKAVHPFCADKDADGCSVDYTHKAYCSLTKYGSALPAAFQYFSADAASGGKQQEMDFCPYFSPYSNGDCQLESKNNKAQFSGESFGASSYCYAGASLRQPIDSTFMPIAPAEPQCHKTTCGAMDSAGEYTVMVGVMRYDKGGKYVEVAVECAPADAGKTKSVSGFESGTFTCPEAAFGKMVCGPLPALPAGIGNSTSREKSTASTSLTSQETPTFGEGNPAAAPTLNTVQNGAQGRANALFSASTLAVLLATTALSFAVPQIHLVYI